RHGEGLTGFLERVFGYSEFFQESGLKLQRTGGVVWICCDQGIAVGVYLLEDFTMQLVELAQALQGVIEACGRSMSFAPHHGHARERDVGRLGLLPRLDQRVDRIAVRAAIPEKLEDLDLARWNRSRLTGNQARVIDAFLPQGRRCGSGCGRGVRR